MIRLQVVRTVLVVIVTLVLLAGSTMPVLAQEGCSNPDEHTTYCPAGIGCDFALQIDSGDGGPQNAHWFVDKEGSVLGGIVAGRGNALTYSHLSSGKTMSTQANGAVSRYTFNPDGTTTVAMLGHSVVILYPTDVPAGPSTTLYVGQVVFTVDGSGVWTFVKSSGTALDICAALSD
jgi:hypothetical protein